MEDLVKKAKEYKLRPKRGRDIGQNEIDLALAWLRDEVSYVQCTKVIGSTSNVYSRLALALQRAYDRGQIEIKKKS